MLQEVGNAIKKQAIDYNSDDFFVHYKDTVSAEDRLTVLIFKRVTQSFFQKISQRILKGFVFSTPLGIFKIERQNLKPGKKRINFGETNRAKALDPNATAVYRENNHYFRWSFVSVPFPSLKSYHFKACKDNNRSIPEYHPYLERARAV